MRVKRIVYQDPAINLPVLEKTWSLDELKNVLTAAICVSAIECKKRNHGIIVTALSGGLDSSFCLAIIRENLGRKIPIYTFTVGSSPLHPDAMYARLIADHFRTFHHTLFPGKSDRRATELFKNKNPELFPKETLPESGFGPYYLLQYIRESMPANVISVITHDGIDELLGGYWPHRQNQTSQEQLEVFQRFWSDLPKNHLLPLTRKAKFFGLTPILPYLQKGVVRYISRIPLFERTSHDVSKIPLREIAKKYLPPEIINRPKIGFCDAMTSVTELEKQR